MALTKINNNTLSAITGLPAGVGGKVLQVVSSTFDDTTAMSSSTYADITGSSLSITPSSTSSKILVFYSLQFRLRNDSLNICTGYVRVLRGATEITETRNQSNDDSLSPSPMVISHLDSPSTTSAVTYKAQQKMTAGTQVVVNDGTVDSYITLMEISG